MRVAKELIKKSVISIEEGKELGEVEDFFAEPGVELANPEKALASE